MLEVENVSLVADKDLKHLNLMYLYTQCSLKQDTKVVFGDVCIYCCVWHLYIRNVVSHSTSHCCEAECRCCV